MDKFLQELKETLKDVEGIDFQSIETSGRAVVADLQSQIDKVNKKNRELLGDKKTLKTQLGDTESIKEEYDRLKAEEEERLQNPGNNINTEEIKAGVERKYKSEIEKLNSAILTSQQAISERDSYIDDFEIGKALDTYLADGRPVMDAFRPMLKKSFKSDAFVSIEDDGERQVYIKGSDGQMPIKEFIDAWKTKDEAKAYLAAEDTSGSGARGNFGNGLFRKQKKASDYSLSEQNEMFKKDRAKYDRLFS